MPEDKQKLQLDLQEVSKQIYELKEQIKAENNRLLVARLGNQLRDLQFQALWYMDVIDRL